MLANWETVKRRYDVMDIDVVKLLGCTEKTLWNKINGITGFTYREAKLIRDTLFPGTTLEFLFETKAENKTA